MYITDKIKQLFGGNAKDVPAESDYWQLFGDYRAVFTSFGKDIYASELIRSCIRTLAGHTSKASPRVVRRTDDGKKQIEGDLRLQRLLQYRPNKYMTGKTFLYKCRALYEINNVLFIAITRNELGQVIEYYPMPDNCTYELHDIRGELYIRFIYASGHKVAFAFRDLAIIPKDNLRSDIFGDDNTPILKSLELLRTANEGISNAIKTTANLRGLIKSTIKGLTVEDLHKIQKDFIDQYATIANKGGVAAMDATNDFKELNLNPMLANYKHIEEQRNNIHRYFGTNDKLVMNEADEQTMENFYESEIEPFLLALSLELTTKTFTPNQVSRGDEILYEANRMQFASTKTKLAMVALVDRAILSINEYREVLNMAPVEGGDVRVIRKEYSEALKLNEVQGVKTSAPETTPTPTPKSEGQKDVV